MRKVGSKSSEVGTNIKEKFGMTLKGYADKHGMSYQLLCQLVGGFKGKIYGPAGIGTFGKIANQLKKDGVWVEPVWEDKTNE